MSYSSFFYGCIFRVVSLVEAKSGCCSYHKGVCCECDAQPDGKVVCNDGWKNLTCYYSETKTCNIDKEVEKEIENTLNTTAGLTGGVIEEINKEVENKSEEKENFTELDKCNPISIGLRKNGEYCSLDKKWIEQKEEGELCENNFECKSNLCIDNECVSGSLLLKMLNWFRELFG